MKPTPKTFAEKVVDLINPAPSFESDDEDITNQRIYDEAPAVDSDGDGEQTSVLRKRTTTLLEDSDARYSGKKISRKALKEEWGDDESETEKSLSIRRELTEEEEEDSEEFSEQSEEEVEESRDDESESAEEGSDASGDESDDDGDFGGDLLSGMSNVEPPEEEEDTSRFQHLSEKNVEAEIEKAKATRCQLTLWDNLLEARMHMQKCVQSSNQLPQYDQYRSFHNVGGKEFQSVVSGVKVSLRSLLDKLLDFQEELLKSHPETKNLDKSSQTGSENDVIDSDEEITSESDEEHETPASEKTKKPQHRKRKLSEYSELISKRHKSFINYRNSVIQKWNDKTNIASGNVHRGMREFEQPTLKQIEYILSDRNRLIQRTQLKRCVYDVLGKQGTDLDTQQPVSGDQETTRNSKYAKEYDTEIFDDGDFYQQLLREFIDSKSEETADPVVLGRKWLELQKLRTKMKKVIDVKATKGRRVRYDVHPKLVNFMAPINNSSWTEEAKNELYKSVFSSNNA